MILNMTSQKTLWAFEKLKNGYFDLQKEPNLGQIF